MTLLDDVFEAYGGTARWEAARRIEARGRTGGFLLRSRVPGSRFADCRLTVEVGGRRTVFDPFPEPGVRGVFERGSVRLERGDGEVLASRAEPRRAFFGLQGGSQELPVGRTRRHLLRRLRDVELPELSPAPGAYFDSRGLLVRHDYVADVVGRWARAAHLCADHVTADGLVFPTRRRVLPIGPRNRPARFPTMVWIELTELQVESE